jgi:microsomal dipeptidase-like Zn-dependent dipeptidase
VAGAPVIDLHVHGLGFLPRPVWAAYRAINRSTMPPDLGFDAVVASGVDVVAAMAVGDPIVTRFHPGPAWRTVLRHLGDLRQQAEIAGARIALTGGDVADAHERDQLAVLLGVEGADMVEDRIERVDELYAIGVRVLGLVHYVHNSIGTVGMPWQDWVPVPLPKREPERGLRPFGRQVVERMEHLGMLVDLAHADRPTTLAACGVATRPVVSSHTGCRCHQDWDRYLDDDEIRAIAGTGGLIGLWPFRFGGHGVADASELVQHARHVADLVGVEHLCVGTDANGVPGYMDGYRDIRDLLDLAPVLAGAGFSDTEVASIMGGNALRVLHQTLG